MLWRGAELSSWPDNHQPSHATVPTYKSLARPFRTDFKAGKNSGDDPGEFPFLPGLGRWPGKQTYLLILSGIRKINHLNPAVAFFVQDMDVRIGRCPRLRSMALPIVDILPRNPLGDHVAFEKVPQ